MKLRTNLISALVLLSGAGFSVNAMAGCPGVLTLPVATTGNTVSFGDALVYSLPILGITVQSSPGQIDDCIVVATGSNGQPINTNFAGMNNAFQTPSGTGGSPWFRTGSAVSPDPGTPGAPFAGDSPNTWDTTIAALKTFLAGNDLVFYFNHNEDNSKDAISQNVAVWAQVKLSNSATGAAQFFYATSTFGAPGLENFGTPGDQTALYTGPQTAATCQWPSGPDCASQPNGTANFPTGGILTSGAIVPGTASFMINAQGQICLSGPVGAVGSVPVPCSGPHVGNPINENLGANEVANAIVFPEINAILRGPNPLGFDTLSIDLRMGCDPTTRNVTAAGLPLPGGDSFGTGCPLGLSENNGFEQVFIGQLNPTLCVGPNCANVPEPGMLALLGVGLLAAFAGGMGRRKI